MNRSRVQFLVGAVPVILVLLAACSSDSGGVGSSPTLGPCTAPAGSACYDITFTGTWTAARHPGNFPVGAHFSPPVGTAHKTVDILWTRDGVATASNGVESMAETGGTSTLQTEIDSYIVNGDARQFILGGGIGNTGSTSVGIVAAEEFPLISLVSMVAPSPDWFVGVRNIDLREGGDWRDNIELLLTDVYDSGTDAGSTFDSADADVTPHLPIRLVADEGNHFLTTPLPLASIVITRIQ